MQDFGNLVRVLLQPCDLHPTVVPKCDCLYDVTLSIPAPASLSTFDFYHRWDFYGATDDNLPRQIGTATGTNRP